MRTKGNIPDPRNRLKARAAQQERSVERPLSHGGEIELKGEHPRRTEGRVALPLIRSKRPGCLKLPTRPSMKSCGLDVNACIALT
jgi:hypothetical protein